MKLERKGFTIVELLAIITVLGILLVIAVPNILEVSDKIKNRSLDEIIEAIQSAAVLYAQDNSNKIKNSLGGTCKAPSAHCECADTKVVGGATVFTDCKYLYEMTVDDLIKAGAYKSQKTGDDESVCDVGDPRDTGYCLDCVKIKIKLDDDYKTATAEINKTDIVDGKTVCN